MTINMSKGVGEQTPKRKSDFFRRKQGDTATAPAAANNEDEDIDLDEGGGTYVGDVYIPPIAKHFLADPTGPRLIITNIIVHNFKSYGGQVPLGPFNKRFNAIIGPNGSGKSNVIDSLLFVFGYRASKIRANKINNLIHQSTTLGGISRCSVTVLFAEIIDEPGDDYTIIPNSELVISRTAHYDNTSYYTLNDKRVQFKEIALLLRKYGVDLLNNRFLILQGEVEQISMMPPKALKEGQTGLLEYLEEIIGTDRYKEPINKMKEIYNRLDEERSEKLTRVQLVESELKSLEPGLLRACNFLELENRVQCKNNEIYQYHRYTKLTVLKEHQDKIKEMDDEMTVLLEENKKYTEGADQAKTELKSVEKELGQKDSIVVQCESKIEREKILLQKLAAEQKETEKRVVKAKDELKKEEAKNKKLLEVPEKSKKEIESLENEKEEIIAKKEQKEEKLQEVMATIGSETAVLQEQKGELQKVQIGLRKTHDDAKSKYDIAQSELEIFLSTKTKEEKRFEDITKNLENVQTGLTKKKAIFEELENKIPELETELIENNEKLVGLVQKDETLTKQARHLSNEVSVKRHAMQQSRSQNKIIDFVMKLKTEGTVSGILGRLGDLGGIDDKYDIAVSTACGPLDYIVTETVEDGQALLAAVKAAQIGRIYIIALSKMEQYRDRCYNKYATPENVPRLIDLIKLKDERIRVAFYFGVRETLVAKDIDQATKVAYGQTMRYRVVSLDGAMIEVSGLMSGGGKPSKGRMGRNVAIQIDSNAIEQLKQQEQDLVGIEQELRETQTTRSEVETKITLLKNELKYKKQEFNTVSIDIKSLTEQEPELIKQLENQKIILSKVSIDNVQKTKMEENISRLKDNMNESNKKVEELEAKVNKVHNKIMEISGGKTNELTNDINELTKRLDKVKTAINKLGVAINANERDVKKSGDKIANLTEEITESDSKLKYIEDKIKSLEEALKTNEEDLIEYKKELKEIQIQYSKLKKSYDENTTELSNVQNKISKAQKQLLEAKSEMENIDVIVKKLTSKLEKLTLHELVEITTVDGFIELKNKELEPLRQFTDEELANRTEEVLANELETIRSQFPKETPNLTVIDQYKAEFDHYCTRVMELTETTRERNKYRQGITDTEKRRTWEFTSAFQLIADKVKETYQLLTTYGSADMSLDDNLNPFSQGINYAIRPPMKSWKNIVNLSGGEKTIASLALVFALHYYKPSPLYFLDEIDAALDVRNVAIIGHYIKERTVNAQFIIISLRPECFDLADRIIGIYKVHNTSKSVAVTPVIIDKLNPHYKPYVRPELKPLQPSQSAPVVSQKTQDKENQQSNTGEPQKDTSNQPSQSPSKNTSDQPIQSPSKNTSDQSDQPIASSKGTSNEPIPSSSESQPATSDESQPATSNESQPTASDGIKNNKKNRKRKSIEDQIDDEENTENDEDEEPKNKHSRFDLSLEQCQEEGDEERRKKKLEEEGETRKLTVEDMMKMPLESDPEVEQVLNDLQDVEKKIRSQTNRRRRL